jgi:hypothetical protein
MEEHRSALGARAVLVEPRIGARIDRRIGGVARDVGADFVARRFVGYRRSSRRMRA